MYAGECSREAAVLCAIVQDLRKCCEITITLRKDETCTDYVRRHHNLCAGKCRREAAVPCPVLHDLRKCWIILGSRKHSPLAFSKTTTSCVQVNAAERRLFYVPSFKIYGSVAGFYDYGPPGCAVKQNITAIWRQHFVLEESMLEVL